MELTLALNDANANPNKPKELWIASFDVSKAFDSPAHWQIEIALRRLLLPEHRNIWDVSQFWQWEISSHLVDFYLDFYLLDLDLLEEPSGVTYGFNYVHG